MKKILVPTDFSDAARNAMKYAVNLYGKSCHYVLINSYEEPGSATAPMISLREILHEASEDSLKEETKFMTEQFALNPANISSVSVYGDPSSAVNFFAEKNDVELIVMGTTGATGMKGVMFGSVAAGVMQHSKVAALIVPDRFKFHTLKKMLFAADLEPMSGVQLPDVFITIAKQSKAEITVLTVKKSGKDIDEERAERGYDIHVQLQPFEHSFEVINSDDVEKAIIDFAHHTKQDLVVTMPRKGSWLMHLFNPSISKKLAEHLDLPILALPS